MLACGSVATEIGAVGDSYSADATTPSENLADALLGARVLIVDDNPANVRLLERILATAGVAEAHGFTDPRVAVDRCEELRPDIVLLDLHMPHLDGREVLHRLRDRLPPDELLPVVVLTADTDSGVRAQVLDEGANDFLTKPFDRVEVVQRARNLVAMRTMYNEAQRHNRDLREELAARDWADRRARAEMRLRHERIRRVLDHGELRMVFQPIVDLCTGLVVGVEALARFDREPHRPPDVWFAEAAHAGLAVELELAAVVAALAHLEALDDNAMLAINASPTTLLSGQLVEHVDGVVGSRLVIELTEHAPIDDYEEINAALDVLRSRGVRIAVDDAGAGYAGLQQILRLRPDVIKLDLTLTRGIDADPVRRALASALRSFADETGAQVVAEGIETVGELEQLRSLGVQWGQGYLLARPGPLPVPRTSTAALAR